MGDHAKQIGQWCVEMSAARVHNLLRKEGCVAACKYAALKIAALRAAILHLHAWLRFAQRAAV